MDIVFSPSINQSVTYPLAALIEEHHSLFLEVSLKILQILHISTGNSVRTENRVCLNDDNVVLSC